MLKFGTPTITLPLAIKKCTVQTECTVYILGMCSFQHKWASERQLYLFVLLHHVIMK